MFNFLLHLDQHLYALTTAYGGLTYLILFLIIFAETGLVFFPFLPGDSLLFAAGAVAALGGLNLFVLLVVLTSAAVLGDTVNYWIGHYFGERLIQHRRSPLKPESLAKTHRFFQKHGQKTIILARFVPLVRTFAPFIAGLGTMDYRPFLIYNLIGGVAWVSLFTLTGYFFGNLAIVKSNFSLIIITIIFISLLPMAYEAWRSRFS
ncbi:hypothetical protein A2W24_02180 [Microgenomates group bacterium RBG_16_45_19]|nr:MAG: hypothetical protein A2W24_02180 [Microgenomates group bacterium RBG_16_45_19]